MDFISVVKDKLKELKGEFIPQSVIDTQPTLVSTPIYNAQIQQPQIAHNLVMENEEGQLALDVYHTENDVVIKAPIAGVTLSDISITVSDGILTVRGKREREDTMTQDQYYLQECYWGPFSRSIVLPNHLKTEEIKAYFKNGILKITIPKEDRIKIKTIPISIGKDMKVV